MTSTEKNVLCGAPLPATYMEGCESLGELCMTKLQELGSSVVLVDAKTSETLTGVQFLARSIRLAQCMRYEGVNNGDKIGICSENRLEFAYVLFATFYLGATVAPINITYTEYEINHAFNLSHPKIIFCSPNTVEKVAKVSKQHSSIEQIVVFADKSNHSTVITYTNYVRNLNITNSKEFKCSPEDIFNKIALILLSSGTTGLPKGVQLTQYNLVMGIMQHFIRPRLKETEHAGIEIVLGVIPWFHAFGCTTLIGRVLYKSLIVVLPKYEQRDFLESIQKYKINTIYIVPPLLLFLAKHPLIDEYDLSSLKVILCGAASISKALENAVKTRLNIPVIRQGYGMTEGTLSLLCQDDNYHKSGSVGILVSGLWGKVIDTETGENRGPYEQGEILIKGDVIMKGYIGDDEATRNTIDKDGWLHTGDIGYYDENEEWFIIDRLKELIKYKSFQVAPAELEAILLQHPNISDVGVVGLPDEYCGELPLAFVVKRNEIECTPEEIIDYVAGKVSPAKHLRGGVIFVNEIPKNASGKILRKVLRNMLKIKTSKL